MDKDDIEKRSRNLKTNAVWVEPAVKINKSINETPTNIALTGLFKQFGAQLANKMSTKSTVGK